VAVAILFGFVATEISVAADAVIADVVTRDVDTRDVEKADVAPLQFGFDGHVKLGHWVPIFLPDDLAADADAYSVTTIDGDESPVTYSGRLKDTKTAYVRFGKKYGSVNLQLLQSGQVVKSLEYSQSDLARLNFARSTDLLTLIIAKNENLIAKLKSAVAAQSTTDETLTIALPSTKDLPAEAMGWQSVNRMIISASSADGLRDTDQRVWDAIQDWVKSGGDLILIADPNHAELFREVPGVSRLIPGTIKNTAQMRSSRDLERFVGTSRRQLIGRDDPPMTMLKLTPAESALVISNAGDLPILVRSAKGFGRISFCALDLEADRLMQWPSHTGLVEKVIATNDRLTGQSARPETQRSKKGLTHSGYSDMLGQLRVPLDDFSTVRFLPFTLVAILITLYILCVAVGDYFLLSKALKKMELTWITFPLIALLFCGLAFAISKFTRPSELQINQMEIVDFDLVDGASRGTAWVNLYAPVGEKVNVDLAPQTSFGLDIGRQMVSWQGLPGDGLGGMENEVSTGFKRLAYQQTITTQEEGGPNVSMEQLPLQVASTKPLLINYEIANPTQFSSQLSGTRDRLEGTFKNPLSVPIYNGKIFFGEYVYLLKKPLLPDVVTLIESDAKERTLRSYLNRRSAKGEEGNDAGRSQNRPWDPDEKSLTRIADVMMFYEAAGGQGYTGLTNGYHRAIDFSPLLRLGKAVLVGQTENGSRIKINGQDVSDRYDSNITMVRMALPVENNQQVSR